MCWEVILLFLNGIGKSNYLMVVINIDNELVEIIDVEKILVEIMLVNEDMDSLIGE